MPLAVPAYAQWWTVSSIPKETPDSVFIVLLFITRCVVFYFPAVAYV